MMFADFTRQVGEYAHLVDMELADRDLDCEQRTEVVALLTSAKSSLEAIGPGIVAARRAAISHVRIEGRQLGSRPESVDRAIDILTNL